MAEQQPVAKRGRGRPRSGRKPRTVQMSDATYSLLERVGDGRAADGLEIVARQYVQRQSMNENEGSAK